MRTARPDPDAHASPDAHAYVSTNTDADTIRVAISVTISLADGDPICTAFTIIRDTAQTQLDVAADSHRSDA